MRNLTEISKIIWKMLNHFLMFFEIYNWISSIQSGCIYDNDEENKDDYE